MLAVLRNDPEADQVAVGAIVGAPFMLATVAMAVVGTTALVYAKRREQGRKLQVHGPNRSLSRRRRFAGSAIAAWCALFATFAACVLLLG